MCVRIWRARSGGNAREGGRWRSSERYDWAEAGVVGSKARSEDDDEEDEDEEEEEEEGERDEAAGVSDKGGSGASSGR